MAYKFSGTISLSQRKDTWESPGAIPVHVQDSLISKKREWNGVRMKDHQFRKKEKKEQASTYPFVRPEEIIRSVGQGSRSERRKTKENRF